MVQMIFTREMIEAKKKNNVWNVFHALGMGYAVSLLKVKDSRQMLRCLPPKVIMGSCSFQIEAEAIESLVAEGLVQKKAVEKLPQNAVAVFELTEKGRSAFSEIQAMMFQEGQHQFHSKFNVLAKKKIKKDSSKSGKAGS